MAEYFYAITVAPNTPMDNPAELAVTVEGEVLERLAYVIPSGAKNLLRFAVFYGIRQIYPEVEGEWVGVQTPYHEVPLRWPMPEKHIVLTVKACNLDTVYPHTLYIWFSTASEEEAKPFKPIHSFIELLKSFLGVSS